MCLQLKESQHKIYQYLAHITLELEPKFLFCLVLFSPNELCAFAECPRPVSGKSGAHGDLNLFVVREKAVFVKNGATHLGDP